LRRYREQADLRISRLEAALAQGPVRSDPPARQKVRISDSGCQRPLKQLSAIEVELSSVTAENTQLRAQLKRAQKELTEWNQFARSIATQIGGRVQFSGEFPHEDGETQRSILGDLVRRLDMVRETNVLQHPDYQKLVEENARTKEKLKKVTQKCNSMLDIVRENESRAINTSDRRCSLVQRRGTTVSPEVLQSFGTHVKELTGLTRRIKRSYAAGRHHEEATDDGNL
jgi:septal ring factor EnvC (AmiA/AmiB activator)